MLRSMTGFGRCFVEDNRASQQWEIRSLNGRHLDLKWRLPALARHLEPALERIARRHVQRGRVEISLALNFAQGRAPKPAFDFQTASAMLDEILTLAHRRGERYDPDYTPLLNIAGLWGEPEIDEVEDLSNLLEHGLTVALDDWNESRETEGALLGKDILERVGQMRSWTDALLQAAPAVKEERVASLRERLSQALAGAPQELDEDRFLQEIVILSDRLDVSEELTRLGAHLLRLEQLLRAGQDVGRKLDFTLQECFREINTCGNKLTDADISRIVVDFKNELEKCREQAQNLE